MKVRSMLSLLAYAFYTYALICIGMYFLQEKLLFHPGQAGPSAKSCNLPEINEVKLTADDGTELSAWEVPATEGNPTLVYFHGNAGTLCDRAYKFRHFIDSGFGLMAVSYRGYGGSQGNPTEEGLYRDARAAVKYVREQMKIEEERIILFGESLGTGVAVQMATEMHPAMLVLEAPFTSVTNRSKELYPYLPVELLLKHRFDSIGKIGRVTAPLLIFHGERDRVIPVRHGKQMLAAASEPKKGVFFKDNGHTDFDLQEITLLVRQFAIEQQIITP